MESCEDLCYHTFFAIHLYFQWHDSWRKKPQILEIPGVFCLMLHQWQITLYHHLRHFISTSQNNPTVELLHAEQWKISFHHATEERFHLKGSKLTINSICSCSQCYSCTFIKPGEFSASTISGKHHTLTKENYQEIQWGKKILFSVTQHAEYILGNGTTLRLFKGRIIIHIVT